MNENEWVGFVVSELKPHLANYDERLEIIQGENLPYAFEIRTYNPQDNISEEIMQYQTDILIKEFGSNGTWKPRLVVEAKISSVTTHDAITYSQKALTHKHVHPYLRYGIILGNRKHYPLPGRLFRHGAYFDFMLSWTSFIAQGSELDNLIQIIIKEIHASRKLEEILYSSRKPGRERYTILHRPLVLD